MTKQDPLIQARKAAEQAVEGMEEGPMKIAAFQTILTQLLQQGYSAPEPSKKSGSPRTKARATSDAAGSGTTSRILGLIEDGVFDQQRSLSEIRGILAERGWHYKPVDLGTPLTRLVRRRQLRRTQATEGGKKIWKYSKY